MKQYTPSILVAIAVVAIVSAGAVYTVDRDEVAIITQFGKITGEPRPPGFHVKIPFVQEHHKYSVRRIYRWNGEPQNIKTNDKRELRVEPAVMWRLGEVIVFFRTVKDIKLADTLIQNVLFSATRDVIVSYSLKEIRDKHVRTVDGENYLSREITDEIVIKSKSRLEQYGIEIHSVEVKIR